jgi:O-antigen ligase
LASELGLLGFALVGALILTILARALRAARRHDPDARYLGLACVGSILALLIHGLADSQVYIPANALLLAWVSGLAASLELLPSAPTARVARPAATVLDVEPVEATVVRRW